MTGTAIGKYPRNRICWAIWVPIIFFEIYLNGTVILFALGPWPWPVENSENLYIYLITAHILLFFGYAVGVFKKKRKLQTSDKTISKLVGWSLTISVLLLLPTSYARSGNFLPDVLLGLKNPGLAYTNAVARSFDGGSTVIIEYLRILLAPFLAIAFPVTVATWSERSKLARRACLFILFFTIGIYIAMGTNKAIFDYVLLIPWLIYMGLTTGRLKMSRRKIRQCIIWGVIFMMLALFYFSYGQIHRAGGVAINGDFGPPIFIRADPSNWLTEDLPDFLRIMIESVSRYLCQGYYALSQSFNLQFNFSYGVGNSIFLSRNFDHLFNVNIAQGTFPGQLDWKYGWGMLTLWDSIYPWIASDVGFGGTLIVVFLIGYFFSMSWIHAIRDNSPLSIALVSYFVIMLFYFPANNQIMQDGESCVGFLIIFCVSALKYHFRLSGKVLHPSARKTAYE